MLKKISGLILILMVVFLSGEVLAAVPPLMNIQGRVTQLGEPLAGKTVSFKIGAIEIPTVGPTPPPTAQPVVTNSNGVFNAILDFRVLAPGTFDFSTGYFIDIYVDSDLVGSQPLLSVPYAFRAAVADALAVEIPSSPWTLRDDVANTHIRANEDIQIGGGSAGYDGDSEYISILSRNETWVLGAFNKVTGSMSDFWIGKDETDVDFLIQNDGKVGIGTKVPKNKLDVEGSAAIGSAYSGSKTAPANGLLVEGEVGIGTDDPTSKLDVRAGSGKGINSVSTADYGVKGVSTSHYGVWGVSGSNAAVLGISDSGHGGNFQSTTGFGIRVTAPKNYFSGKVAIGKSTPLASLDVLGNAPLLGAIVGQNTADYSIGVLGIANKNTSTGVSGNSTNGVGVYGVTQSSEKSGVMAQNTGNGPALELGSGWIKIPSQKKEGTNSVTINRIAGKVKNTRTDGGYTWITVNNTYVGRDSIIIATPQDYAADRIGVQDITNGSFELRVLSGKTVAFLVINK